MFDDPPAHFFQNVLPAYEAFVASLKSEWNDRLRFAARGLRCELEN
jgi:hypothetical protein